MAAACSGMRRAAVGIVAALALTAGSATLGEPRIANVSQGTNIALALSPDGESLVVDLLGRLWQLPSSGGAASQLTPDHEAARHPRFSPDGRHVVYQRLIDGQWDLWLLELSTGARRALVESPHHEREPDFTPDGREVVFAADRTGHFCLWRIDVATGILTQLTEEPGDASFPTVSEHGEIAYVRRDGAEWSLRVLLPMGAGGELWRSLHRLGAPSWRPGGSVLTFTELEVLGNGMPRSSELKMLLPSQEPVVKTLTRAEDVFESRPAWISPGAYLYAADGRIWRRGVAHVSRQPVHLFAAVAVDAAPPAPLETPLDAPGPHEVHGITGYSASANERVAVFTALGDLWLLERRGGVRRLTDDAFVEADASVAPEGDFAVFASDRGGYMDLWRITLPGGIVTQLTRGPAKAYLPSVSPDGRRVAFLETGGVEESGSAALRVLDLNTGLAEAAPRTLAQALLAPDRPRWDTPESVTIELRSAPHAPVRDRRLAFDLFTGRSREAASVSSRASADVPVEAAPPSPPLHWHGMAPAEPYVIQVGRLFDGVRSDYRRHVDIHIEGQRIKAIVARGMLPLPGRVVDERDSTVIPGLIDLHAHHSSLLGERLGRAWLAHGVTTVRELASDIAEARERAESWASGRRLGPRLIISPVVSGGGSAGDIGARAPSPLPVRNYPALRAADVFLPPGERALGFPAEHVAPHTPLAAAISPLRLSYGDVFSTLVESRAAVTSSLAAAAGGAPAGLRAFRALASNPIPLGVYTTEERALWSTAGETSSILQRMQQNLVRLARAGGQLAAGSDAPLVPYGLGIHLELGLLADAGIPQDQVLRIATASNALALGLERQLGTLEPGKLADLVIVAGDPLADVADALNVKAVVRGGVWLDREQLLRRP